MYSISPAPHISLRDKAQPQCLDKGGDILTITPVGRIKRAEDLLQMFREIRHIRCQDQIADKRFKVPIQD
jgi:hypothetical protein